MRIFVAGPWWDTGAWAEYVAKGFQELDHQVRLFLYSRELNRPIDLRARIQRRLIGEDRFQLERLFDLARDDNVKLLHDVEEFDPELIVIMKGEVFLPETLHTVKRRAGVPIVQWCGDNPFWFPNIIGSLDIYDWFFLADGYYAPEMTARGARRVEFLPHAADPNVYSDRQEPAAEGAEVIFVGDSRHRMGHLPENWYRVETLEAVARMGVDLAVYGRGWETLPEGSPVKPHHRAKTLLPAQRVAAAYRASKIVLNVHHPQIVQGCNMRTFEAAACGAFQLVDDRPSLHQLFNPPEDLVTYSSPSELTDLIRRYLADPDQRRAVAERGRRRVLAEHTYTKRLAFMLSRIAGAQT